MASGAMAFRFVHTADIHLDSPLRSLSLRDPELAGLIGDATRQAFIAIIDLCLEEQVDALVIAGDLYDGEQTSMKTARFLSTQLERLHVAGIPAYIIRGNHDALSKITQELVLPPSITLFGARADAVTLQKGGLDVVLHGLSFAKPQAPDSLLTKYKPPVEGAVNIGIMHTSLAGAPGHDAYAPCNVIDLHGGGFDYWALGHIHQRAHHRGARTVIMPGMPQGRDINEAGPKTVSLVTVADDRSITVEERRTSIAEFARVPVDISAAEDWRGVIDAIETALAAQRENTQSPHLVARLMLSGATPLSFQLRRDRDLLQAEAEQRAERIGHSAVEKIELDIRPVTQATLATADPVAELDQLMRQEVMAGHGFRTEIRQMVSDLLDDLPPEARKFAGSDEAGFEAFLDGLMADGGDDIIARLRAPDREAS